MHLVENIRDQVVAHCCHRHHLEALKPCASFGASVIKSTQYLNLSCQTKRDSTRIPKTKRAAVMPPWRMGLEGLPLQSTDSGSSSLSMQIICCTFLINGIDMAKTNEQIIILGRSLGLLGLFIMWAGGLTFW